MTPLKYSIFPSHSQSLGIYIDGFHVTLDHKPFIEGGHVYLPLLETVSYVDRKIDVVGYQGYSAKKQDAIDYVEALYFEKELGLSIAWEDDTRSLYIASDYHYDGYRHAPNSIFKEACYKYHKMFMYVDGSVLDIENGYAYVSSSEGPIKIHGQFYNIKESKIYRFCFSYDAKRSTNGIPYGELMELVRPCFDYKDGFMYYTKKSWETVEQYKRRANITSLSSSTARSYFPSNECFLEYEKLSNWKQPLNAGTKTIAELVYTYPANWGFREAPLPFHGCYYYPYDKAENGMVYLSYQENKEGITGRKVPFNGVIFGMCKSENDIVNLSDIYVANLFGKKVRFFLDIEQIRFESVSYIFATASFIYVFSFMERGNITNNMLSYADEFIKAVTVKSDETYHPNSINSFSNSYSKKWINHEHVTKPHEVDSSNIGKENSRVYVSSGFDPSEWPETSILRDLGYTVSQQENLSDRQRQAILQKVMDSNIMSKYQIINHLKAMISLKQDQSRYSIAISKWERDIEFVRKYSRS